MLRERMMKIYAELNDIYMKQHEAMDSITVLIDNLTCIGVPITILVQIQDKLSASRKLAIDKPSKEIIYYGYGEAISMIDYSNSLESSLTEFKCNMDSISDIVRSAIDVINMSREEVIKECINILNSSDLTL